MATNKFFQDGGSLFADTPSYIERQADKDLSEHLEDGQFCYVLAARQMGKSSLGIKTIDSLIDKGWTIALVDLSSLGKKGVKSNEWYYSFLTGIIEALELEFNLKNWWEEQGLMTPVKKMNRFFDEILLKEITGKIAIFIDEIDFMMRIDKEDFATNDFFAAIKSIYNQRGVKEAYKRLNFSIFGVATPQELMSGTKDTPFNIGRAIPVLNFTELEAISLKDGFSNSEAVNKAILKNVLYWTGGQPYLTQMLGKELGDEIMILAEVEETVEALVKALFLRKDILKNNHFSTIGDRLTDKNNPHSHEMLEIYRTILEEKEHLLNDIDNSPAILYLKLSGIVQEKDNTLIASNRLYTQIFDLEWQRRAYARVDRPIAIPLQRWLDNERKDKFLMKGKKLTEVENWANILNDELSPLEQLFLRASQKQVAQRQKKWFMVTIFSILLIGLGISSYANNLVQVKAEENRLKAMEQDWILFNNVLKEANNFLMTSRNKLCPIDSIKSMDKISIRNNYPTQLAMKNMINLLKNQPPCKAKK